MPQIAIIDDNSEQSETVQSFTELVLQELNSDLTVITTFPLRDMNSYFQFITENDVVAIIIDEKLNDQSFDEEGPVEYKGSQLVTVLRTVHKQMPIFTITAVASDPDLQGKFSEYDHIIQRSDFYENSEKYVPIISRSVQRFLEQNSDELTQFDSLTKQIASGEYEQDDVEKLSALQVKLEMPFTGFDDRNEWLNMYQQKIEQLDALRVRLLEKIQGSDEV